MKILLCILVSACLAVLVTSVSEGVQKLKDKRNAAIEECKKEQPHVTEEDWSAVRNKGEPKNEIQHCFINCVYEKMGIVKDGKLVNQAINQVTQTRHGHNQTLFSEENYLSQSCQKQVESNYGKFINKCYVPNAYHSCVAKKRAERVSNAQKLKPSRSLEKKA